MKAKDVKAKSMRMEANKEKEEGKEEENEG